MSVPKPVSRSSNYDAARRRRSKRAGRERGCWLYVPEAELNRAGFVATDPPPFFRVWGQPSGGLFVRLYREG